MRYLYLLLTFITFCFCAQTLGQADTQPEEMQEEPVEEPQQPDYVSLLFAGDMMQHDAQIEAAYDSLTGTYDYSDYFTYLAPMSATADIAVCNFEITLGGKPYKGYPTFSAPDEYLDAIIDAGFDIFLTANNHCLDKGKAGLERTIKLMGEKGVTQLGTYLDDNDRSQRYPVVIECRGLKIGFLNYTYGTNGLKTTKPNIVNYIDEAAIAADVEKCREMGADYIIANMHWGEENTHVQNADQRKWAKMLVAKGVDHIIGHHPHMVQPAEIITDADTCQHFVIYSLGNVVSNMQRDDNAGGIVVGLNLPIVKDMKAAPDVWYTQFHVSWPYESGLKNYNAFTPAVPDSILPDIEITKRDAFYKSTRDVMSKGTYIKEIIQ